MGVEFFLFGKMEERYQPFFSIQVAPISNIVSPFKFIGSQVLLKAHFPSGEVPL